VRSHVVVPQKQPRRNPGPAWCLPVDVGAATFSVDCRRSVQAQPQEHSDHNAVTHTRHTRWGCWNQGGGEGSACVEVCWWVQQLEAGLTRLSMASSSSREVPPVPAGARLPAGSGRITYSCSGLSAAWATSPATRGKQQGMCCAYTTGGHQQLTGHCFPGMYRLCC
jgi:hypothetical protein